MVSIIDEITVINKHGVRGPYSYSKLTDAINKACYRVRGCKMDPDEEFEIVSMIEDKLLNLGKSEISTADIHRVVEQILLGNAFCRDIGEAYFRYRSDSKKAYDKMQEIISNMSIISTSGDLKNANADSALSSTMASIAADEEESVRFEETFCTNEELQAMKDGYIYVHDKPKRLLYNLNCCLFLLGDVLRNGCEMNGIWYNQPTSLSKAFNVMQDLILSCASQQYGGFTVPRIDEIIEEYAIMSAEKYAEEYRKLGVEESKIESLVDKKINEELHDGFQGFEYKLNTVASSRGDYPFTTFSAGLGTGKYAKMASIAMFEVRAKGQGKKGCKKPVLFPKLVFLYDKNLHGEGKVNRDVYDAGINCSLKACYPDWLSLTGEGYISDIYKQYGLAISPMGCRAFLSPWYERGGIEPADEKDRPIFEGRFNLGAVSLHLPMILAKARKEGKDFYEVLDYYLELIRNFHKRTYAYLSEQKAGRNPVAFCYGGFYGGNLKPDDKIAPVLKSATMSFGYTGLNELNRLFNGKSIFEDGEFPLEVLKYINKKLVDFKKVDKILYAVYGTPAESLCGKQVVQFRAKYGIIENVSDKEYVSNSFHCHVTENITPIQKQDAERRFWELSNGGKIQYCRQNLGYNRKAVETLINRAMDFGFYEGVNISLNYCDDCGYEQADLEDVCPKCGSVHITTIDRMNGYLGYTRMGKYTSEEVDKTGVKKIIYKGRFNAAKAAEIRDRISM